ncbi:lactate racemase domain-containing protein [Desulfosporosinus sp. SB140]|uniref:lactate racemase domain-containing protein n=1 Tax=Desulfosporosinus paludis TaxID=3115649 RepID=UPI00388D07EF
MDDVLLPSMARVRQTIDVPVIDDVISEVRKQIKLVSPANIRGKRIAITAGSRGITDIRTVLRTVVQELKNQGAQPFLVPAMGSHGGATAEGQREVLKSLGITAESIGAPIMSSMEVVEVGTTVNGVSVYADKYAANADGIVVVNRIKAHTEFCGEIESGLFKMMVIGLGKHKGATIAHTQALRRGYAKVFKEIGEVFLEKLPILFGLGIVENCYDQTAEICGVSPGNFYDQEKKLLVKAKNLMMRLPFKNIDLLIVDKMGKNISGCGMDTNVVGRIMVYGQEEYSEPDIVRVLVLDLDEGSHGNATGIGIADFTTKRLMKKIDWAMTSINCLTACAPEKGRLPMAFNTDLEAVKAALMTVGLENISESRVVHIKNTLEMKEIEISAALMPEAKMNPSLQVIRNLETMNFDQCCSLRLI